MKQSPAPSLREPTVEPLVRFERPALHQLDLILSREWLETNGRGGYATSTPLLCPMRRYHGLLVVPPKGTTTRHVFLTRFEETLHKADKSFPLSMARYPGVWSPHGHQSLERFELVPYPSFLYRIGSAEVVREILMVRDSATTLCRYRVSGIGGTVELRLRPLLASREADKLTLANLDLDPHVERLKNGIGCRPYASLPAILISLSHPSQRFEADPVWYRQIEYPTELARGYDGREDNFSPGTIHLVLKDGEECVVAVSVEELVADPASLFAAESMRRRKKIASMPRTLSGRLDLAADDFLVRGEDQRVGVIAGYPWFGEWGRDTFLSLPGLTLARGKLEECGEALSGAIRYLRQGLLPNIFGRGVEDSHYGSVDASLWFARAVLLYQQAGAPEERMLEEFLPVLAEIAQWYQNGTALGIHSDDSGLLFAGSPTTNVTWMDAQTQDGPVTPRYGFAVEVNALWYSLLRHLERLYILQGDAPAVRRWMDLKRRAGRSFLQYFWLERERYLADCWRDGEPDRSIRPNMVIAAALEYSPLTRGKRTDVVKCAQAELLTPRGLRTLAPQHPDYLGHYGGSQAERDKAYHQGTVWPWLVGFYVEAMLRAFGKPRNVEVELLSLLQGFEQELSVNGLNHISEVFDGDPPHLPGGSIAQAWNVAELLRASRLLESFRS